MKMVLRRILPIKSTGQMLALLVVVVELWDSSTTLVNILYSNCCQWTNLPYVALLCIRFQMRVETFEMINSTTDPCGPGTLLSVLTLAYCNVITIKLYIDQGDSRGDQNHINPSTVHSVIHYYCISWIRSQIIATARH